jgi:hypothetical protein
MCGLKWQIWGKFEMRRSFVRMRPAIHVRKVARQVYMVIFRSAGTGLYFRRGLKMTKSTTATVTKARFGII